MFSLVDEYHTTPSKYLVNFVDLNRILKSEIFLHKDNQLRVAHVILGYKPLTKCFQNPKNIIKAKDPQLALIDVAVPGFLLVEPPPVGTQDAQLLALLVARLLYSQEPCIPSNEETKEPTPEPTQEVTDKDFEVFYQQENPEDALSTFHHTLCLAQVSINQERTNIPKGMGFEEKTPDLPALLTAYVGGFSPVVAVVP